MTPSALRNSSPRGAPTTTAKTSPAAGLSVAAEKTSFAKSLDIPAKKMATPPPHRNAAIFVHQGSGSKRSTKSRKEMTIDSGKRHMNAKNMPYKGPATRIAPKMPRSIIAAPAPMVTPSKTGRGFLSGSGMTHTWAACGAACGYWAVPGPGMEGPERTKERNPGVN